MTAPTATRLGRDLARGVTIAVVLALVVAGALWWVLLDTNQRRYVAMFSGVVGLYEDNDVRVLGVKVGEVDSVEQDLAARQDSRAGSQDLHDRA